MLVDSHCHLDFDDFADELPDVIARAREAGVGRMVSICTRPSQLDRTLEIAGRFEEVFVGVGVHPHEAAKEGHLTEDELVALSAHPKVVAIGESGLDYHYDHSPRETQRSAFRTHIRAARRTGLPLIVHTREAEADTVELLTEGSTAPGPGPLNGVIHCFSGTSWLAERSVALGMHISFSGILTFRRSEDIRDTARSLPLDRLLVETDAPYLAPVPKRGRRNEPAYVAHTAGVLGELHGLSREAVAAQTTETFFRLFAKVPRPSAVAAA